LSGGTKRKRERTLLTEAFIGEEEKGMPGIRGEICLRSNEKESLFIPEGGRRRKKQQRRGEEKSLRSRGGGLGEGTYSTGFLAGKKKRKGLAPEKKRGKRKNSILPLSGRVQL